MTEEKGDADPVRCEGYLEMVRPLTGQAVSLVAGTVVTVHSCPSCGGHWRRKISEIQQ